MKKLLIIIFIFLGCETVTEPREENSELTKDQIISYLSDNNFDTSNLIFRKSGVVVEGDMFISYEGIKYNLKKKNSSRSKQYYAENHLVSDENIKNITIYMTKEIRSGLTNINSSNLPLLDDAWDAFKYDLQSCIDKLNNIYIDPISAGYTGEYNNLNYRRSDINITFLENVVEDMDLDGGDDEWTYNYNQHADIVVIRQGFEDNTLAEAILPISGVVGKEIRIGVNALLDVTLGSSERIRLVKHEILHSLGFKHSDIVATGENSGSTPIHISNTPLADGYSIMNSTIDKIGNDYSSFDEIAITELYPFSGKFEGVYANVGNGFISIGWGLNDRYDDIDPLRVDYKLYNENDQIIFEYTEYDSKSALTTLPPKLIENKNYYFTLHRRHQFSGDRWEGGEFFKSSLFSSSSPQIDVGAGGSTNGGGSTSDSSDAWGTNKSYAFIEPNYYEGSYATSPNHKYAPYKYGSKEGMIYDLGIDQLTFKFSRNSCFELNQMQTDGGIFEDDTFEEVRNVIELKNVSDGTVYTTYIYSAYYEKSPYDDNFVPWANWLPLRTSNYIVDTSNLPAGKYTYRVAFSYLHIDWDLLSSDDKKRYNRWTATETFYITKARAKINGVSSAKPNDRLKIDLNVNDVSYINANSHTFQWYYMFRTDNNNPLALEDAANSTDWIKVKDSMGGKSPSIDFDVYAVGNYRIVFKVDITGNSSTRTLQKTVNIYDPSAGDSGSGGPDIKE